MCGVSTSQKKNIARRVFSFCPKSIRATAMSNIIFCGISFWFRLFIYFRFCLWALVCFRSLHLRRRRAPQRSCCFSSQCLDNFKIKHFFLYSRLFLYKVSLRAKATNICVFKCDATVLFPLFQYYYSTTNKCVCAEEHGVRKPGTVFFFTWRRQQNPLGFVLINLYLIGWRFYWFYNWSGRFYIRTKNTGGTFGMKIQKMREKGTSVNDGS